MPELSVLLPYRDAAATLEAAIDSVLSQRSVDLELLAVDDGSRDAGPACIARRAATDPRVRPLSSPVPGIAHALNSALEAARAPLCARMDADDLCAPDRFARQLRGLREAPGVAVLGCRVQAFPEAAVGEGMHAYLAWQNALISPADHARQLFVESPLCHPSVVMRRRAVLAIGGYRQGDFPEDYDLWLRLDAAGHGLAKLPQVLLRWRMHAASTTFRDARYGRARFLGLKAPHLVARLRVEGKELVIWGAGKTGKQLARALEVHGVKAARFVDIDPAKMGRRARGAPILSPDALGPPGAMSLVVAVGARGARDRVREHLDARGFREGVDYFCGS